MTQGLPHQSHRLPPKALAVSVGGIAIPILGTLFRPAGTGEAVALLWLFALIPTLFLSYYRGWRGGVTSLALAMGALVLTQLLVTLLGGEVPSLLVWVAIGYIAIAAGIIGLTERLHGERASVEDLALTDVLTHLPNRRHARIFMENEFGAAQRGRPLTLALFGLDHFKEYHDRYGQQAADEVLTLFAGLLASTTRRMNLSARYGSEEFLAILAGSEEEGAVVFGERIREGALALPLKQGSITVSVGIASYHPSMQSADDLIAAADLALYRAKEEGRNCVRVFGRPLSLTDSDEGSSGHSIRGALEAGIVPDTGPDRSRGTEESMATAEPTPTILGPRATRFGQDRQVLLVEDEDPIRNLISTYLKREGFTVTEARDAPAAVLALSQEFDVVITDIRLPGASGNELVPVVKSRWPLTQVIVITGFRDAQVAAEALNSGADRYLFKPFGMPELQEHLTGALTRRDRLVAYRQERIDLTEEARRRGADARETILKGARALVTAVEVRDQYTRGHSMRVADYTGLMARELIAGGGTIDLEALRLACELHDVGKIGIPDAILNKPGALTPDEFFLVQRHPAVGKRILEPLFGDDLILAVTGWHHERWDGEGYPDHLAGDAIPLPARLVAFADTLDAMTSSRAYRPALRWEDAVRQIRERGGSQFDPHLMDLFDAALPEMEEAHRRMGAG